MFLQIMNQEEKENFLELVYKVAVADGEYADEEQEIVDSYKKELEIESINDNFTIEELITYFATKDIVMKKVVLFETLGLVNSDAIVEKCEEEILLSMNDKFKLGDDVYKDICSVADKLQKVYDEVYDVLFE